MIAALIPAVLPLLVKGAELLFPKRDGVKMGDAKKAWVLSVVMSYYDSKLASKVWDLPRLNERKLFEDLVSVAIDHAVRAIFYQEGDDLLDA